MFSRSLLKRPIELLLRAREALDSRELRGSGLVAAPLKVVGAPHVVNQGRIEIGAGFSLTSRPVQSHIVVHRGAALYIGSGVTLAHGCGIACHSRIDIGDGAQLGGFTMVLDSDYHVPGNATARAEPKAIRIGRGVRIGSQVTILRGSDIGDGAVIEPGSVVSGDIPAGARVSGVPARLVQAARADAPAGSLEERVARAAMQAFRLRTVPALADGPAQIPTWDSLGALSLLIGLEEEFGVVLTEQDMRSVRRLDDIVQLLARVKLRAA